MEAKAKFEKRLAELQKQAMDNEKNNKAIEELKKAHAKELADHV